MAGGGQLILLSTSAWVEAQPVSAPLGMHFQSLSTLFLGVQPKLGPPALFQEGKLLHPGGKGKVRVTKGKRGGEQTRFGPRERGLTQTHWGPSDITGRWMAKTPPNLR